MPIRNNYKLTFSSVSSRRINKVMTATIIDKRKMPKTHEIIEKAFPKFVEGV
jgi:hypothetical protein